MKDQLKEMGQRLAELREINNVTAKELADKLKMTEEEYVAYENGEKDFSFSFMFALKSSGLSCPIGSRSPHTAAPP